MKVILLRDIKDLGKKFDVKEVASGYARNFLIPRKLAVIATPEETQVLNDRQKLVEERRKSRIAEVRAKADKLNDLTLEFKLNVGEKGEVFGSVSSNDIKKELEARGFTNVEINLEKPIKILGERSVQINLGEGIETSVKILVTNH